MPHVLLPRQEHMLVIEPPRVIVEDPLLTITFVGVADAVQVLLKRMTLGTNHKLWVNVLVAGTPLHVTLTVITF